MRWWRAFNRERSRANAISRSGPPAPSGRQAEVERGTNGRSALALLAQAKLGVRRLGGLCFAAARCDGGAEELSSKGDPVCGGDREVGGIEPPESLELEGVVDQLPLQGVEQVERVSQFRRIHRRVRGRGRSRRSRRFTPQRTSGARPDMRRCVAAGCPALAGAARYALSRSGRRCADILRVPSSRVLRPIRTAGRDRHFRPRKRAYAAGRVRHAGRRSLI